MRAPRSSLPAAVVLSLLFSAGAARAYDCEGHPDCCRPNCDNLCCYTQTGSTCIDSETCTDTTCIDACAYCDPQCLAGSMQQDPNECMSTADCKNGQTCQDYDCNTVHHCAAAKDGGPGNCCVDNNSCADGFECCPPNAVGKRYCDISGTCGQSQCGKKTFLVSQIQPVIAAASPTKTAGTKSGSIQSQLDGKLNWTMDLEVTDNDGVALKNIKLGMREMAEIYSLPYVSLRTSPPQTYLNNPPARCELKPYATACTSQINATLGQGRSRLTDFSISQGPSKLVIRADYEIDPETYDDSKDPPPKECFRIEQYSIFEDKEPNSCNSLHSTDCFRYYPLVSARYFNDGTFPRLFMRIPQRFVWAPDGHDDGGSALLGDVNAIPEIEPNNPNGNKITLTWPLDGNPLVRESRQFVVLQGKTVEMPRPWRVPVTDLIPTPWWLNTAVGDLQKLGGYTYGSIDNYHQTCKQGFVDEPGVSLVVPRGGCPDCAHMHWRWDRFASIVALGLGGGNADDYGWGQPLVFPDPNLDLVVTSAINKPGEEDPEDYRSIVYPNMGPMSAGNPETFQPGSKKVFWYETLTKSNYTLAFKHGGFFVPNAKTACPPGSACAPRPPSDKRLTSAEPKAQPDGDRPPGDGSGGLALSLSALALTAAGTRRARKGGRR